MRALVLVVLAALVAVQAASAQDEMRSEPSATVLPQAAYPGSTLQVLTDQEASVGLLDKRYPSFQLPSGRWRTFVPLSAVLAPGQYSLTIDRGSVETLPLTVGERRFAFQRLRLPKNQAALEATKIEESAIGSALRTTSPQQVWQIPFRRPVGGRVSTGFGLRRTYNGVPAPNYYHRGLDYAAPAGTQIIAPAAGRVILVGTTQRGFRLHGNTLVLDHGQGITSIYIHLQRVLVRQGATVKAGEPIARVGSTGRASGPHLHWGVYVHGVAVDPVEWLSGKCCQVALDSTSFFSLRR